MEIFFNSKRGELIKFTHSLVDVGADLVLGHGPHIVRGLEIYKNKMIAYSLGNFATYNEFNLAGLLKHGMILNLDIDSNGDFITGKIIPTVQKGKGIAHHDDQKTTIKYVRALSKIDFSKSPLNISSQGILKLK